MKNRRQLTYSLQQVVINIGIRMISTHAYGASYLCLVAKLTTLLTGHRTSICDPVSYWTPVWIDGSERRALMTTRTVTSTRSMPSCSRSVHEGGRGLLPLHDSTRAAVAVITKVLDATEKVTHRRPWQRRGHPMVKIDLRAVISNTNFRIGEL